VEEAAGLRFVYNKEIAPQLADRVIDYHTSPQEGFSVTAPGPGDACGGCSC
jgi:hypothetical protein